ncbi:MAG: homoserine O-succinyltransferase [Firmicutes bacterium]|jgi:homoserine O-succinyltransferase|nr:homoserine O-succinyltransferase [Bacillota bacterium]NBI63402.1 homoserine O-succinyltransferase [Clostridiales bacterium]
MPLIIPNALPAAEALQNENIFTMDQGRAMKQDIRPLKIVIVNLMPTKIATETQLARVLANSPLQVEMTLVRMDSHSSTHISQEHMDTFYKTLDEIKNEYFDGMILTGAPVEQMPYEDVDYWKELCEIFEFCKTHVYSNMFICWGAQAALYYYYGIDKHLLDEKVFGVFEHKVTRAHNPMVRGFDSIFYAPHSRHTEVRREDVLKCPKLRILAESEAVGPHIISTENGRQIFILGHQEYDKDTLAGEYFRDVKKGLDIGVPANYFRDDDPEKEILFRWRAHANLLFSNWLNYYVYQATPYDLKEMK